MECRNGSADRGASIADCRQRVAADSADTKAVAGSRPETTGTHTCSALAVSRRSCPGTADSNPHHTTSC